MTRMKHMGTMVAAAVLAAGGAAQAQLVRLEKQATVEPRADVRLGDIATVSGTDRRTAEDLSNTIILSAIDSNRILKAESILLALMSQRGPQKLTNLQLSGAAQCTIAIRTAEPAKKPAPGPAARAEAPAPTAAIAATPAATAPASTELTLQKVIEARVQQEATATGDTLRVTIDALAPQLTAPVPAGRRWICRPLTRTLLGTVNFEAQLTEGGRVVDKLNIQTKIEKFQQVVVSMAKLDRGDVITAESVRMEEAWLDRNLPTLVSSDKQVLGLETTKAVALGTMLDSRDFRPALMASKGESVNVIYLSGNLKVQMRGRAMADGKLHELLSLRNEQTGETYQATLIGKRLAVVGGTLSEAEELKLRETR